MDRTLDLSNMSLPFLPGNSRNSQLGKERFHKSQLFEHNNGVPMLAGANKPGIGGAPVVDQQLRSKGSEVPSWLAFNKQALRFQAYFEEPVVDVHGEGRRIRKCQIFFYLEDDTIQVEEPEYKNSGIPQGTLIRRQRIPLPPPDQERFYNVLHFNINQQVVLFSRVFTITDCDPFTRNFLTRLGVVLNPPAETPGDPYSLHREQLEEYMQPLRPYERHDTLKQFLELDGKVLRFFCVWNDPENPTDPYRDLVLLYFLSDDTVEILDVIPPNGGRDPIPKFLRRCRLPKCPPSRLYHPGEITTRTVLNVLSSDTRGTSHYILDNQKMGAVQQDFYQDWDLTVGGEVNVLGRRLIITDCDDFTKEYYRSKYGIEDFTPVQCKPPRAPKPPQPPPPYNGFGSEEDSLGNCMSLLPKPPRKDFHKFMKTGVLNFLAKMESTDPVNQGREFSVSFHLSDDSMSVFERAPNNSGLMGGMFLRRSRVKKPSQDGVAGPLPQYFEAEDLFIGAKLCLNGHTFVLLEADQHTLRYMEDHHQEFPKADVGTILSKLRSVPEEKQTEIRKYLNLSDPAHTGSVSYDCFRTLLLGLDCGLTEHEVLVLGRRSSDSPPPDPEFSLMLAVVQDLLKKNRLDWFPRLAREFSHRDRQGTGRLPDTLIRTVCKSFSFPLSDRLLQRLIHSFSDGHEVDYHAFVAAIDWTENPAPPVIPDDVLKFDVHQRSDGGGGSSVKTVRYSQLLQDVFGFLPGDKEPLTTN